MGITKTNRTQRGPVAPSGATVDLGGSDLLDGSDVIWDSNENELGIPAAGLLANLGNESNFIELETHDGIADAGKAQLVSSTSVPNGFAIVIDRTNGTVATFEIDGPNTTVTEINDPGNVYTTAEDNDTTTNVYHDAGNARIEINNETGGAVDYSVILLG